MLSFPDKFSQSIFECTYRKPSQVFVIEEKLCNTLLKPFLDANKSSMLKFENEKELEKECKQLSRIYTPNNYQRFQEAVASIFKGVSLGISYGTSGLGLTASVTLATNQNKCSVSNDNHDHIVFIKEDQISPKVFGRYLEFYTDTPTRHQPIVIIEASEHISDLTKRLSQCPESYVFSEITPHAVLKDYQIPNLGCHDFDEFVNQYISTAFSAVASTDPRTIDSFAANEMALVEELSTRLMHIRSIAMTYSKFKCIRHANALDKYLTNKQEQGLTGSDATILLLFKALNNLMLLYAGERARGLLDNSMAIACALGDTLLQAHCLRYINLLEGPSAFTEFCLRGAAQRFEQEECFDHANYCINNLLVGKFYSDQDCSDEFERLIQESAELIPNLRGLGILYNNAGVSHLISGKIERACQYFDQGLEVPNMALHSIGISVNRIISRRLLGYTESESELIRIAEWARNVIDPNYRYQLANILLNLLCVCNKDDEAWKYIHNLVLSGGYDKDPKVVSDTHTLLYQMYKLGLKSSSTTVHSGLRGEFIERYGLVPIIHFAWL